MALQYYIMAKYIQPSTDSDVTRSTKFAWLGNTKIRLLQVVPDVVNLWFVNDCATFSSVHVVTGQTGL